MPTGYMASSACGGAGEWVPACRWRPLTTFRDECTLCSKVFVYPNSNGYPEEEIRDGREV